MTGQLLLTIEEAAQRIAFKKSKVYAMAASGELPAVRFGRCVRIPAAELERWVAERIEGSRKPEAA